MPGPASMGMVEATVTRDGTPGTVRRHHLPSARRTAEQFSPAVRAHWRVETSLHRASRCFSAKPGNTLAASQTCSCDIATWMRIMLFGWDAGKLLSSIDKHGFDFLRARRIFDGRPRLDVESPRGEEDRILSIAILDDKFIACLSG